MDSTQPIKDLASFLTSVKEIRNEWKLYPDEELWFRGEDKEYKTYLVPKIYRQWLALENRTNLDFFEYEYVLYDEFQRTCPKFLDKYSEEYFDWDTYVLMQNHGAPTRLLDWTDGALIALHFAIRDKSSDDTQNPIIYILNPFNDKLREMTDKSNEIKNIVQPKWKDFAKKHPGRKINEELWEEAYLPADEEDLKEIDIPNPPLLLQSPHLTSRLGSQRSRMVIFGKDPWWFQNNMHEDYIKKIKIDSSCCEELKIELRDSGITESVIFPDLDGLGKEMDQLWKIMTRIDSKHK
ncbi:FRG domain-containing protein [Methylacidiphilum caldifontis]|uniref:FRG domain-containing protein n=1 Tax=Methylacidiphilum caldifontis TaxID=2795386 RepID=UPI001A907920|nr:FRG domain-containing protein [Methylacidiphilum caldifontis]QSR88552.1 FRG domain-containing protein [Methylacidiphilum caldifontis]